MSELRPFNEVKLQWLRLLSQDKGLSARAVQVGLYLVMVRYNVRQKLAKTAHSVIADDLGICTKTVQRSIKELHGKWFLIEPGKNTSTPTTYQISPASHVEAHNLREEQEAGKTDKIVHLRGASRGQKCLQRRTNVSSVSGQKRPPNIENPKLRKDQRTATDFPDGGQSALALEHAPSGGSIFEREWDDRLRARGLPPLHECMSEQVHEGRRGYWLPGKWPGPKGSTLEQNQISIVVQMAGPFEKREGRCRAI
ncbi:hypothetical protein MUY35_04055 [Aliiroseovarius sp. S1339]|uniref:hypothetical protein n=1 Tax=Aliiroseovarius sp. S1339 TaxID=2936990 RepID=UPI0020C0BDCA|nr:hypothetical protein [Aliiroseovarius sp. S1339]MCK8463020.1 hypothetical protein [Aliiroseovarius sp. S1339]